MDYTISSSTVMAKKITQVLGIDLTAVRDIRISLRYDDVPTLTIEKLITDEELDGLTTIFTEYELIPKPIKKED